MTWRLEPSIPFAAHQRLLVAQRLGAVGVFAAAAASRLAAPAVGATDVYVAASIADGQFEFISGFVSLGDTRRDDRASKYSQRP